MGIDINGLKYLLTLKVNKNKAVTVGRQNITVPLELMHSVLKKEGYKFNPNFKFEYSEDLFKTLGFAEIDSIDYSDYEGANLIHDMNIPIKDGMKGQYDLVFDGGTLEHIFNFPLALKNCMDLVKKDGLLVINTTANNYLGHGFYQFSPELFYRVFCRENGFEIISMYLVDMYNSKWTIAEDPFKLKQRIEIRSINPLLLFVVAKKIEDKNLFDRSPLQSDYFSAWKNNNTLSSKLNRNNKKYILKNSLKRIFPKCYNILHIFRSRDEYIL